MLADLRYIDGTDETRNNTKKRIISLKPTNIYTCPGRYNDISGSLECDICELLTDGMHNKHKFAKINSQDLSVNRILTEMISEIEMLHYEYPHKTPLSNTISYNDMQKSLESNSKDSKIKYGINLSQCCDNDTVSIDNKTPKGIYDMDYSKDNTNANGITDDELIINAKIYRFAYFRQIIRYNLNFIATKIKKFDNMIYVTINKDKFGYTWFDFSKPITVFRYHITYKHIDFYKSGSVIDLLRSKEYDQNLLICLEYSKHLNKSASVEFIRL